MSKAEFAKLIAKEYTKPWFRESSLNLGIKGLEVYEASDEAMTREDPFIPHRWILVKGKIYEHDQVDKAFIELKPVAKDADEAIHIAKAMISIVQHKVKFYPDYPGLKKPNAVKMYGGYIVNIDGAVENAGVEFEKSRGREVKPEIRNFVAHVGLDGKYPYGFHVDLGPGLE